MEGDVGEDSVVQDSSSGPPRPDSEERASGSSSGCAKLNKLDCDNASEEPTAGPSNSAADFDLEVSSPDLRDEALMAGPQVFDSGSSCSNEECWEVDEKGSKIKLTSASSSKDNKMSEIVKIESSPSSHQQNHQNHRTVEEVSLAWAGLKLSSDHFYYFPSSGLRVRVRERD